MFPKRGAIAISLTALALVLLVSFRTPADEQPAPSSGDSAVVAAPAPQASSGTSGSTGSTDSTGDAATGSAQGASQTIDGPVVDTRYGPVQVEITVDGSQVTGVVALQLPDGDRRSYQQIIRTRQGTLLAMGIVMHRSTDEGKTWQLVEGFRTPKDGDYAEGRYLTVLSDGRLLVTWGVGTNDNSGLYYNFSDDDGLTWNNDHTAVLFPQMRIAARYYSGRTVQIDEGHVGTVFL